MKKERTDNKEYTGGIAVRGGFLGWFDNYWYHHKWTTIIVSFFVIVGLICTVQMCNKDEHDIVLVYAGPTQLSVAETRDIASVLEAVCPEDFDKSGSVSIALSTYCVMSKEQIKNAQSQKDENGDAAFVDNSYNSDQYDTYLNYIGTGESSVLLLDEWLYESLAQNGRLVDISNVFGYTPNGEYGKYGIRLGDTSLYSEYGVMRKLPEDTVICLLKPYVMGKSSKEKYYEREERMFEAIVSFGKED